MRTQLISQLLRSKEPSIRWKTMTNIEQRGPDDEEIRIVEKEIVESERVAALLQWIDGTGRLQCHRSVYDKWQGTHWVLMTLADLGYPSGRKILRPLADHVFKQWLSKR